MDQKVLKHRFLKYLWLLHTLKKLIQSHLLRPGSGSGTGSGPRLPDPDPTKNFRIRPDRIRIRNTDYNIAMLLLIPSSQPLYCPRDPD
jgi:hypothetical protein